MIEYQPRYQTRTDEMVAELRKAAGAAAPMDPKLVIKRKTAEIATAMALLHGGDWRVQVDHHAGMVLVVRR
ncbi:hypothetical protein FJ980_33800 [Mesorhizobium sp. B1-1-5]|nr:hypothetical protein FJ980_33800 [Mesorhizobium sp. B1-1-5]